MEITSERFKALLNGSARDVTGEERVIRVEAFMAERRGEDPATAVQAAMPHVSIVEVVQVMSPSKLSATNTAASASVTASIRLTPQQRETGKRWLCGFALIGMFAVVVWIAVAVGMAIIVAHFIGVALFGLFMQSVNWFYRAPIRRSSVRNSSANPRRWE
jgi:hypothetical protein